MNQSRSNVQIDARNKYVMDMLAKIFNETIDELQVHLDERYGSGAKVQVPNVQESIDALENSVSKIMTMVEEGLGAVNQRLNWLETHTTHIQSQDLQQQIWQNDIDIRGEMNDLQQRLETSADQVRAADVTVSHPIGLTDMQITHMEVDNCDEPPCVERADFLAPRPKPPPGHQPVQPDWVEGMPTTHTTTSLSQPSPGFLKPPQPPTTPQAAGPSLPQATVPSAPMPIMPPPSTADAPRHREAIQAGIYNSQETC